jgi:hypothetical protein
MALRTLATVDKSYFIMCEDPTWIDIHWNDIWLRARLHVTSHYTRGPVITIQDFGSVFWWPLDTFLFGGSPLTMSWSRLFGSCVKWSLENYTWLLGTGHHHLGWEHIHVPFLFINLMVPSKIFPHRNEWNWKHHVRKFILDMTLIFQKPPFSFWPSTHLSPKLIWSGDLIHGFKAFGESLNKEAATSLGPI